MNSRLIDWLRLLRAGALFSPAADVVAGLALADLPWSLDAVRCCVASVFLYGAGMVLNDHADRAIDRRLRPERPIPAGRIRPGAAFWTGVAMFLLAVLLSPRWPVHLGMALAIVAYDYGSKRFVLGGVLVMGALRATNLLSGVLALTGTFPEHGPLRIAAFCYFVYIAAVTVLGIFEDQPPSHPRPVRAILTAPPFAAVVALSSTGHGWLAGIPGALLALLFLRRLAERDRRWDALAIRRSMLWLLLGTMLFDALLCVGSSRPIEATAIAVAAVVARRVARRIAPT
ncbi:MAG: UbiA family prenyltransferase [Planctomycetota bacterium]